MFVRRVRRHEANHSLARKGGLDRLLFSAAEPFVDLLSKFVNCHADHEVHCALILLRASILLRLLWGELGQLFFELFDPVGKLGELRE